MNKTIQSYFFEVFNFKKIYRVERIQLTLKVLKCQGNFEVF